MPEQVFKIEIKSPIMLDKNKIGELIHNEILTRETKLLPGKLHSATGIKTNI